jgi:hypothetical protein
MKTVPVSKSLRINYRSARRRLFPHLLEAVAGVPIAVIFSPVGPQLAFIWTAKSREI